MAVALVGSDFVETEVRRSGVNEKAVAEEGKKDRRERLAGD